MIKCLRGLATLCGFFFVCCGTSFLINLIFNYFGWDYAIYKFVCQTAPYYVAHFFCGFYILLITMVCIYVLWLVGDM